jgi:hypothetical protein
MTADGKGLKVMNKSILWCLAVVVSSSSCVSVLQVKKDKLSAVKKVAIVGYTGVVALEGDKPKTGLAATIGAIKGSADLMSGKLDARRVEQAQAGYAELAKRLSTGLGVAVADPNELGHSQTFTSMIAKSPSSGLMVAGLQHLPNVLRPELVKNAKANVRQAMASDLGVDAIATVNIRYEVGSTGGFAVAGMGKTTTYPRAVIDFTVYDATGAEVWHDLYARGETAKEGLATTMGAEIVANESQVLGEALSSGYDALMSRYETAK